MLRKISVLKIISHHFQTLRNDNSRRADWDDYFTFLLIPAIVTVVLVYFRIKLNDSAINILITTLSIFVGLLFNIIVLIFDIIKRDASQKVKNEVLKQLLANIAFTILISIVCILLALSTYIKQPCVLEATTALVYFCVAEFFLTVLMVLKRMYLLFKNEIDEIERQNNK